MGPTISYVSCREVVSISEVKYTIHGVETSVHFREVVPISEGPLSEVYTCLMLIKKILLSFQYNRYNYSSVKDVTLSN